MTGIQATWDVAVIREQRSWFAGRRRLAHLPTPPWALSDPALVIRHAGERLFTSAGEGVVVWQPWEPPGDRDRWTKALLHTADEYGWTSSDAGAESGWFTFRRRDALGAGPVVLFCVGAWTPAPAPGCEPGDPADRIAARLARYRELTGVAWRGHPGLSGCAAIRREHEQRSRGGQPLWRWDKAPREVVGCSFELRGSAHRRPMSDDERGMTAVYEFDTRAAYLAAAMNAEVGWSAPEHLGPHPFDPKRSGYWSVRRDQLPDEVAGLPLPVIVRDRGRPLVTTTTPVMLWLAEQGVTPEVMDAWACERSGRHLRAWAERLRNALTAGDPGDMTPALKQTYSRTVGLLGKPGGRIFRPDWRDEVVDRARINLVRRVAAAGLRPLRWNVDAVWVASDEPPEVVGARLAAFYPDTGMWRPEVGKLRHARTLTPAEYLAKYERSDT